MDDARFDHMAKRVTTHPSRRTALRLIATAIGGMGAEALLGEADARKKKRKRRKKPPPPPPSSPLIGGWREEVQFACGTGAEVIPALPIASLTFFEHGVVSVNWPRAGFSPASTPPPILPSIVGYDGTYVADLTQGTLRLAVSGGEYIPPDFDGEGRIAFDAQGRLLLTELWLGSPRSNPGPVGCGHRFRK